MSRLLQLFPSRGISLSRGEGNYVFADDRRYLDVGGANHGVAVLGHAHPSIQDAIATQSQQLLHTTLSMESPVREAFLERLHGQLPSTYSHSFLANSGTEAWECALKLAAQHTGRSRFVAARGSFHGRSLGSLATTGNPAYREPFQGLLPDHDFVAFNDVDALANAVSSETAAICLEPIQGEGGVHPAQTEYLRAARDLATDHGALLLLDEIQTGFGRTGTFLHAQQHGVDADITTLAKGVAGGLPIGVCSVSESIAEGVQPGSHGSTYGGNPLVAAAGIAALDVLEQVMPRASEIETQLRQALGPDHMPLVRGIRGCGAMLALDLRVRSAGIVQGLQQQGVLALTAGPRGVRLLPSLFWDQEETDQLQAALLALQPEVAA